MYLYTSPMVIIRHEMELKTQQLKAIVQKFRKITFYGNKTEYISDKKGNSYAL